MSEAERLEALIDQLAELRDMVHFLQSAEDDAKATLEQVQEYQIYNNIVDGRKKLKRQVKEHEVVIRNLVVKVFSETGIRYPGTGRAYIQMVKTCVYDETNIHAWCVERAPGFLNLNTRAIEKAAKSGANGMPIEVTVVPRGYIKGKLDVPA